MESFGTARHWIAGEWQASGERKNSVDPATGRVIGAFHDADTKLVEFAIDTAASAFRTGTWRHDPYLRTTALCRLAEAYDKRLAEVVDTLCLENGKLRGEAQFEAQFIPRALRFAAGLAMQNYGRVADTRPGHQAMTIRQPVGVAGLIIPWNSPAYLTIRALVPALAAGCSAVVKLPYQAAHTAALLGSIFETIDEIPKGIVNIFIESGSDGAKLLVDSPKVPVINFTGSSATGRLIAQAAAKGLKRVGLELGGKTPHLIFDDARLDDVLPVLEKSCTVFGGQFCMTGSRVLVQRGIADAVRSALTERLRAVKPGPAVDPSSQMGPLIDKASVTRVDGLVEAAIASGAKVLLRGGPATEPELAGGAFYRPTLLEVGSSALPIVQQEVFGPVQTLQTFETEEEAIRLANETEYGLSACVWSRDVDRPLRVARQLDAGLVSINNWANLSIEFEEGGFKSSGLSRLAGLASLDDFIEYKQITQDFIPRPH